MKTRQSTPRQILLAATNDAMNRYAHVLIAANLIDKDRWRAADTASGSDVCTKKYKIAEEIASKWEKALEKRIHPNNA